VEKYNLSKNKDKNRTNEIEASSRKRQYSLAYKKKVVAMAAECKAPGELGALLRREGLASSTLHMWRVAEANGKLCASHKRKRGPEKSLSDEKNEQLKKLERENAALKKRLEQAEAIIDLQKKIAKILNLGATEDSGSKQ
jgi:transposase-like protein